MKLKALVLCWVLLLVAGIAVAAPGIPAPPKDAKCPVCGMFVAKYADWSAALVYRDGARRYFDGPKDLFTYCLNPKRYDAAHKIGDVVQMAVKDYYSLSEIDPRTAFFVVGSNIRGPMGSELIPFARRTDAESFLRDHHGKMVLRYSDVTPSVIKALE